MGQPSGEVIARPMVVRACGCSREFQYYAVDKYRAQRLAKFQKTRCEECVAKLNEAQRQAAANIPKKGEAFKQLPPGTQMTIKCRDDGTWTGSITADGTTAEADGEGPQGVALALARAWMIASGKATAPKPVSTALPTATGKPPFPPPKPGGPSVSRPTPAPKPAPSPLPKPKPS